MKYLIFLFSIFTVFFYGCSKDEEALDDFSNDSGTFIDERDGQKYKWVKIGDQIWMAENMAYDVGENSWAYNYGRLYTWESAFEACPYGWHLPTDNEWEQLAKYVSDQNGGYSKPDDDWDDVGKHLKASGTIEGGDGLWHENNPDDEGTDDFGFSALPGGLRYNTGKFKVHGTSGSWWSATQDNSNLSFSRSLKHNSTIFYRNYTLKVVGYSVRCVRD